jgi:hypothetical protein
VGRVEEKRKDRKGGRQGTAAARFIARGGAKESVVVLKEEGGGRMQTVGVPKAMVSRANAELFGIPLSPAPLLWKPFWRFEKGWRLLNRTCTAFSAGHNPTFGTLELHPRRFQWRSNERSRAQASQARGRERAGKPGAMRRQ